MFKQSRNITTISQPLRRRHSSLSASSKLDPVPSIPGPFTTVSIAKFQQHAFVPQKPLLIRAEKIKSSFQTFPAAIQWVVPRRQNGQTRVSRRYEDGEELELNCEYLAEFKDTILPYELFVSSATSSRVEHDVSPKHALEDIIADTGGATTAFHRFSAPLQLFLAAASSPIPNLYIAQAQALDLPLALRSDLPTPPVVLLAGKGDVYDQNVWLGYPPTYTPLHKDPNPNLFVQLASRKAVRMFEPHVGRDMFASVKRRLGESGRADMRGNEMMEGKERELLEEIVWGGGAGDGYIAELGPMDALFIPCGWWHSIKSVGQDVNASVNWWFR